MAGTVRLIVGRPRRRIGNVPAEATSFVGRRRELAETRKTLARARLVSLVGPGGVGKTRLAVRVATDLERGFPGGAWWVDLAEIRDAALVTHAVVAALDLRDQAARQPMQVLLSHLGDSELLLVLDNCEHVLDASSHLVVEVLRAARNVRVMTTTREPLQVQGEHIVPVPPLALPPADGGQPLSQLRQNEAVQLFTDRAAAASGTFQLTDSNQAAVAGLCRRLDGLPLAIELAAVRTRVLTAEQILDRLTDRFALLTGGGRAALPRQQTLRTTIDWSHDLLTPAEQTLLRRLCVFASRFTVHDAESVCAYGEAIAGQALDVLSALVDKSLVTKEDVRGVACYRLHETMREYAGLKLRDADEQEVLDESYLAYYWARCLETEDDARHRTLEWLQWVELEIDNIRSALQKCLATSDWRRGLELATSIGYYWVTRGTTESIRWLDELLAAAAGHPDVPARAYHFRGWLSMLQIDTDTARTWLDRAIAATRSSGQLAQLSESLTTASAAENMAGDAAAARRLLGEAEALASDVHSYPASIGLIQARAISAFFTGDLQTAEEASSDGARLSRAAGDLYCLQTMLMYLGQVAMLAGDVAASKPRFVEALRVARQIDDRITQYVLLSLLSWHAASSGQPRLAAQLQGAAETLGSSAGTGIAGPAMPHLARANDMAISALGAPKFEAEYEAGRRMGREAALRLALSESERVVVGDSDPAAAGPLAKREVEVARLVAEGLTNKQIGTRLFISERTVATHVGHILNKLGFDSRAQIASWMASSGS
ncbi:MAG TPA: LuxR C-terminal-related transcriptional regulator [Propionibacteriaceae bacterium]|nr:LuxR C-terminal-related transcriptional regulator [Propionibacteriaceae bacterium]